MASDQIHAGFVRNRRFLVAVSIGLACVKLLDLHFTKVNVLGNEAGINNQAFVGVLEWILWLWALAQYTVWFNDVGAATALRQAISDHCERSLGERVAAEPIPQWTKADTANELRNRNAVFRGLPDDAFKYQATYMQTHGDGKALDRAADIQVVAVMRLPDQRGEDRSAARRFERVITADEWNSQWAVSRRHMLLHSRFLLEYFAPFAIAALPVLAVTGPILVHMVCQLI